MDDLIFRKAAIECAIDAVDDWDGGWNPTREIVIGKYFAELPAVDAALVVHGQWLGRRYDFKAYKYVIVPYDATTFDNPDDLFCSVCNTPALLNGAENDVPSNYCPNCGAKMDGDADGKA